MSGIGTGCPRKRLSCYSWRHLKDVYMLLSGPSFSGGCGSPRLMAGLDEVFSKLKNSIILSYTAVFSILGEKNYCMC